jgi:hypothetical protein
MQKLNAGKLDVFGLEPQAGAEFAAAISAMGSKTKGSILLIVKYTNARPASRFKVNLVADPSWREYALSVPVEGAAVASVTLKVTSRSTGGKWYLDNASLVYNDDATRGDAGVLPPPSAPDGFRGNN